ncbi:MAG: P63C domain-containing protein [Defluviitaleaceae bacterium]|nr:P63C domain-containing protein [Defluviitaleaceae bacterium]
MDKRRKITHEGEIVLGSNTIPCYVLEDGTRVLSGRGMQEALHMVDDIEGKKTSGQRLNRYLSQKTLEPFIYADKAVGHFEPLECYLGTRKINGYEANILVDICEAFLEARKIIELSPRQKIIADQCEILVRGFARVGLVALIDEATGYQYDRERDELQRILSAYVSSELMPWQQRFPDTFYIELFRLNGWDYTVKGIKKRPGVVGRWTNKLVYEQLPKGVLDELKRKTPKTPSGNRTHKLHQLLTDDIGHPHLTAQINQIITLFLLSDSMQHMWVQFEKMQWRKMGQMELPFVFDDKGHTVDLPETETQISEFNKNLETALNYYEKE